jgi:hypothetical protein
VTALFKRKDYPRVCDVCGWRVPFQSMKYVGAGRYVCTDDKSMMTAERIARHNARPLPELFRPRKHPRPLIRPSGTYQFTEGEHIRLATTYALTAEFVDQRGAILTTVSYQAAAACGIYLADLAIEGKRPADTVAYAKAKALLIADALIAQQYGAPGGPGPSEATNSRRYGGVLTAAGGLILTLETAFAALLFLRAYSLSGATKYLDAADRCGHYFRNLQRCDQWSALFTASSAGGAGRYYLGGWPVQNSVSSVSFDSSFRIARALPLWFLAELRDIRGGSAVYGSVAGGDFASDTTGTLDTAIAEAIAFYVTGKIPDAGTSTPISPISPSTPRRFYTAFLSSGGGDGKWHLNGSPETLMLAFDYGCALRSIFEATGYTAAVAATYEYLMGFSSNSAFEATGLETPSKLASSLVGTYDPTLSLAAQLSVKDANGNAIAQNGSTDYMPSMMGLLAPIHIASGRSVKTLKDELEIRREIRTSVGSGRMETVLPGPTDDPFTTIGCWGMGLQSNATRVSIFGAALVGMLYRYQPQDWNGVSVH